MCHLGNISRQVGDSASCWVHIPTKNTRRWRHSKQNASLVIVNPDQASLAQGAAGNVPDRSGRVPHLQWCSEGSAVGCFFVGGSSDLVRNLGQSSTLLQVDCDIVTDTAYRSLFTDEDFAMRRSAVSLGLLQNELGST